MNIWQSGRESGLLDDIIAGRKVIEGRLKRGKFAKYRAGDHVELRRDIRNRYGELQDGEPGAARVEIVAIREYADFMSMVSAEGYDRVIPSAANACEAAGEYNRFYSSDDQARFGVLAIEVRIL